MSNPRASLTGPLNAIDAYRNMKKNTRRSTKYPAATMAYYGPDNVRATKVVVAIVRDENAEPDPLRRWMSATDVRRDQGISREIQAFLKKHDVKTVVSTDLIIGCPHEEGKDYPEGASCPLCPFWAGRDRFTHEIEE